MEGWLWLSLLLMLMLLPLLLLLLEGDHALCPAWRLLLLLFV